MIIKQVEKCKAVCDCCKRVAWLQFTDGLSVWCEVDDVPSNSSLVRVTQVVPDRDFKRRILEKDPESDHCKLQFQYTHTVQKI